ASLRVAIVVPEDPEARGLTSHVMLGITETVARKLAAVLEDRQSAGVFWRVVILLAVAQASDADGRMHFVSGRHHGSSRSQHLVHIALLKIEQRVADHSQRDRPLLLISGRRSPRLVSQPLRARDDAIESLLHVLERGTSVRTHIGI